MQFNDLLEEAGIEPKDVLILRHRPKERELRKVLPWLAVADHDVYNAYQQTQTPRVEKALTRAGYFASFIGHEPGRAVFVGLYEIQGATSHSPAALRKFAAHRALGKYGLDLYSPRKQILWFNLALLDFRNEWKGRLMVDWPGMARSYWRRGERNIFQIHAILEDSILDQEMPPWNQIVVKWHELDILPKKWEEKLKNWRGIYFIFDEKNRKGYVGAAYGAENIYQRWKGYAKSGHGGNMQLRLRNPKNFHFSILQIVPHDMKKCEVEALEATWKDRLHTREFGMNDN